MAKKGFYVDIKGINETIQEISIFETKKREEVKSVIKQSAKNVRKGARSRVLVESGDTKKSISIKFFQNGLLAWVRPKLPKGWKAHFHEFGTVKMKATPFMGPAEEEEIPNYISEMKKVVKR